MALLLSNACRSITVDTLRNTLLKMYIFNGTAPASPNDGSCGTLLLYMVADAFAYIAAGSNGTGTWSGTCSGNAIASGTAGYARWTDNGGTEWIQSDSVGTAVTCEIQLTGEVMTSGSSYGVKEASFIQPAS